MSDRAFESLLAATLQTYAEGGVRPIDAGAIASASMTRPAGGWLARWRESGRLALLAALAAVIALSGMLLLVGSGQVDRALPVPSVPAVPSLPGLPTATRTLAPVPALPAATTGRLAYTVDDDVYIADGDGSNPILVADGSLGDLGYREPTWSRDGRFLAYEGPRQTFSVVDASGRPVASGAGCCIAWAPDATRIASLAFTPTGAGGTPDHADRNRVTVIVTGIDGSVTAEFDLPEGTSLGSVFGVYWFPDGRSIVVSRLFIGGAADDVAAWRIPIDGSAPQPFPIEPAYGARTLFSPEGSLAVGVADGRLVVANADGSGGRPLVPTAPLGDQKPGAGALWSPRGDRISYGLVDGLAVVEIATGEVTTAWSQPPPSDTTISYAVYPTGWSGDGARVLFETYDPASLGLWSVGVDGSAPEQLVAGEISGGSWQLIPAS